LHERGIDISYDTVRFWWNRFGPLFAAEIRKKRVSQMRAYAFLLISACVSVPSAIAGMRLLRSFFQASIFLMGKFSSRNLSVAVRFLSSPSFGPNILMAVLEPFLPTPPLCRNIESSRSSRMA
jgi:hypothetical protein